jgi:hypothetical protein
MKEAYSPLPKTVILKNQISVPDPSKIANWTSAPLLPGMIPFAIPQNTEEFDTWARSAHIAGNYQTLQQVHEYMRYINKITPEARSPLMNHVLASWRLPSWLPEEQQLAQGLCRLKDPHCLEQPGLTNTPECWVQFMHQYLY